VNTEGFACPNGQCSYSGITDAHIHALVGDGVLFSSIGTGEVLQHVSDNQAMFQAFFRLLGLLHLFATSFFCCK
jgi:hypothetical protein